MAGGFLQIDLEAIVANWRDLDAMSQGETAAVVKANAYGLGVAPVARALKAAGVRSFCVALADEGVTLRKALGPDARIYVFAGYMRGDETAFYEFDLIPLLNSAEQVMRFLSDGAKGCGLQLDTGMNRLGLEAMELASIAFHLPALAPQLVISHLACADDPAHPMNGAQLATFHAMTLAVAARKSLSATGGILLGTPYHFDMTRPGIGLYGGAPFLSAKPVVKLSLPVIQTRSVLPGEGVGYGMDWLAKRPSTIATVAAGYGDGLLRALGNGAMLYDGKTACPIVGRISMDLIGVDITKLASAPTTLDILNEIQTIDVLAKSAGTIGYEILTSLGGRYRREYIGGAGD